MDECEECFGAKQCWDSDSRLMRDCESCQGLGEGPMTRRDSARARLAIAYMQYFSVEKAIAMADNEFSREI